MVENIGLKKPSLLLRVLEGLRIREITPADICRTPETLGELYRQYPDLAGDHTSFDSVGCQSWRGCRGWWQDLFPTSLPY